MKEGKAKEGKSSTIGMSNQSDFSLAVAARALAASTVVYHEPHSRGMTFSAYDAMVKETLLPPFSDVVPIDQCCGRDISSKEDAVVDEGDDLSAKDESVERALHENDKDADAAVDGGEVKEMLKRFNGNYELYEKYDRSGKQKVRCLVAVVHGRVRKINSRHGEDNTEGATTTTSVKDNLEYLPGAISMTFRGTDTLENVLADVKAITVQYDDPPFVPSGIPEQNCDGIKMGMKNATVHHGFRDAWYGDDLRQTVLQYACDKVKELNQEIQEVKRLGLAILPSTADPAVPTIDIVGHSLGGSIAVLAAFDLAKSLSYVQSSKQAHIRVYTMGCPRVGNVRFAKLFNKLVPDCWNIINDNDIVPAIPHSPLGSRLPVFCPCREMGYMRHGRAVILKDNGDLLINPSKREKYRREAKVLRLKKAMDSHKTKKYRSNIRAAIQNEIDKAKQLEVKHIVVGRKNECKQEASLEAMDDILDRLGKVINEALSDPNRSFRVLPGGT
ncbi:hypothetical protein ACHAXR_011216 [Thalassiosira sp. AJA248-18]